MSRALLILTDDAQRAQAIEWIREAKPDSRIEFKGPRRNLGQNDRMWAMLTDISNQMEWHNTEGAPLKLSTEDWKLVFLDALKRESRLVPAIDGDGFVALGRSSSSDLSKEEMSNLFEIMFAFGAKHGIVFQDDFLKGRERDGDER